jgi:hypothetical protein
VILGANAQKVMISMAYDMRYVHHDEVVGSKALTLADSPTTVCL